MFLSCQRREFFGLGLLDEHLTTTLRQCQKKGLQFNSSLLCFRTAPLLFFFPFLSLALLGFDAQDFAALMLSMYLCITVVISTPSGLVKRQKKTLLLMLTIPNTIVK
jgi:hypothetical protein